MHIVFAANSQYVYYLFLQTLDYTFKAIQLDPTVTESQQLPFLVPTRVALSLSSNFYTLSIS